MPAKSLLGVSGLYLATRRRRADLGAIPALNRRSGRIRGLRHAEIWIGKLPVVLAECRPSAANRLTRQQRDDHGRQATGGSDAASNRRAQRA
jgi:hypothetical protein